MSVRRSLAWTYSAQGINFLIAFGSSVVVARLVSPRDFGIFAMAGAVTTILNLLMQFGLAKYIMREREVDRDLLRSLFTVNSVLTLAYVLTILGGAMFAFHIARSIEVGRFLTVFALYPAFSMFEFIPAALCAREMRFGPISLISVLRAFTLAASTIVLALLGWSYMSFAWAAVFAAVATAIAYNAICWRPDVWWPRLAGFRSILRFGAEMVGIGGFNQLATRAGEMALGSIMGLATLGLYARAASLPSQLYSNIYGIGSGVIFSRLSQNLRDAGSFHETYTRFMRIILGLLWPATFGLAILARPLVLLLYGPQWVSAADPLSLLMLAVAVTLAVGMTSEIFVLRHETGRQVGIEAIRSCVGLALFVAAAFVSLTAVAAAKLLEAIFAFLIYRRPMSRLIDAPEGELESLYRESLLLGSVAALPVLVVMLATGWSATTPWSWIVAAVFCGVCLWGALLFRRRHPLAAELVRFRSLLTKALA